MPTCSKCGATFLYADDHVCEGRNYAKIWLMASIAAGALGGGPLGYLYGLSVIRRACERPDAGNLCGLTAASMVPGFVAVGVVVGAAVAAFSVIFIVSRGKFRS